jgi:hypothetical protein
MTRGDPPAGWVGMRGAQSAGIRRYRIALRNQLADRWALWRGLAKQRPSQEEQHGSRICQRQHGLRFDPALNSRVVVGSRWSCARLRHWSGGRGYLRRPGDDNMVTFGKPLSRFNHRSSPCGSVAFAQQPLRDGLGRWRIVSRESLRRISLSGPRRIEGQGHEINPSGSRGARGAAGRAR